jgi:transcriptional regulator with XRE-family HTH domain
MKSDAGLIRRVGETLFADGWVTPLAKALGVSRKTLYQWQRDPPADIAARLLAAAKAERVQLGKFVREVDSLVARLEGLQ